ncbi:MAG: NTP transferase domain-containing protein [Thermoflexales bacterium]|nr:NTP transferase domain-containing protein [Thermoflexales bacterium]
MPVKQAVILAAGRGKRLQPLTLTRSKAMMPIAGLPMIERVMDTLTHNGLQDFVLVVSPDDEAIYDHFTRHSRYANRITWAYQAERHGMAHALMQAAPHIHGDFVLSACDNLVPEEHIAAMLQRFDQGARGVLSLMRIPIERSVSTGMVALNGDHIARIVEKPQPHESPSDISSLPLYVFASQVLDYLPLVKPSARGEYELQDAIQMLIDSGEIVAGVLTPDRLTVTNANDLLKINLHYLATTGDRFVNGPIDPATQLIDPILIEAESSIGANCTIGPAVYVESGATIGHGATVRESIVLRGASVPPGAHIAHQVIA